MTIKSGGEWKEQGPGPLGSRNVYQMTFMNSNISYTVQIMGIILKGCFSLGEKKKERKKIQTQQKLTLIYLPTSRIQYELHLF